MGGEAAMAANHLDEHRSDARCVKPQSTVQTVRTARACADGQRWYVVASNHRQTHAAKLWIEERFGFEVLLPWVSCPLAWGPRELRPLFGCYLFVRFDAERDRWGDITRMPYVPPRNVLCMAGSWRPAAVADDLVDALWRDLGRPVEAVERRARRLAEAARRQVDKPVVKDPVRVMLSIGAQVRLTDPPMPDGEVLALRQTGARQVRVLFRGRDLPMWVPADKLQQLQEAS